MQVVRNDIQKNYEVKIIWNNTAIMRKLLKFNEGTAEPPEILCIFMYSFYFW